VAESKKKFGTPVTFQDSGGTVTSAFQNLAGGAGRRTPLHEFDVDGYAPEGIRVRLELGAGYETAPALGDMVALHAREGGVGNTVSSVISDDDGNADGAVSSVDKLRNNKQLLVLQADEAAADIPMALEADFEGLSRHLGFQLWNFSADNLQNTANVTKIIATPWVREIA
jgi:hypothetical protein